MEVAEIRQKISENQEKLVSFGRSLDLDQVEDTIAPLKTEWLSQIFGMIMLQLKRLHKS